jgi:hypothetical protein
MFSFYAIQLTVKSSRKFEQTFIWKSTNIEFLRGSVDGVVTRISGGRSGIQIPAWARNFSAIKKVQTGFPVHPATYSIGIMVLSRGYSFRSVKLAL